MMNSNIKYIALLLMIMISCNGKEKKYNDFTIKLTKINQHNVLKDHSRQLTIENQGKIIHKQDLYSDPGSGCKALLFENDSIFGLIDCNGDWYSISKNTGEIKRIGWNWKMNYEGKFVGMFVNIEELKEYKLSDIEEDVYRYKDPTDF